MKKKPANKENKGLYSRLHVCAVAQGIDRNLLRMAKSKGLPGFKQRGAVDWNVLRPEFERRRAELEEAMKTDRIGLDEQIRMRDLRIRDLKIRKMEGNMLDPREVKKLLVELATATSAVIKKELGELPPRIAGKAEIDCKVEIDKSTQAIFKILKHGQILLGRIHERTA